MLGTIHEAAQAITGHPSGPAPARPEPEQSPTMVETLPAQVLPVPATPTTISRTDLIRSVAGFALAGASMSVLCLVDDFRVGGLSIAAWIVSLCVIRSPWR